MKSSMLKAKICTMHINPEQARVLAGVLSVLIVIGALLFSMGNDDLGGTV